MSPVSPRYSHGFPLHRLITFWLLPPRSLLLGLPFLGRRSAGWCGKGNIEDAGPLHVSSLRVRWERLRPRGKPMAAPSAGSSAPVDQHGLGSDGMQPQWMWDTRGHLSTHLSVYASVLPSISMCMVSYLPSHHPYKYSSSIHSFHLSIHLPVHRSSVHHLSTIIIYPFFHPSIHPFI